MRLLLVVLIFFASQNNLFSKTDDDALKLVYSGTDSVYFSYNNKPLFSFGCMSDFIFYASEGAYDYKKWADWQAAYGMNHCRAYLPGSWTNIEKFAKENGGDLKNVLFPYQETEPGSRMFDLNKFNDAYWDRFRKQCEYLQSKGIIIDMLMLNGWQFWNYNDKVEQTNWGGHFFNPINNINACTTPLDTEDGKNKRFNFYYSVADNNKELFEVQTANSKTIIINEISVL